MKVDDEDPPPWVNDDPAQSVPTSPFADDDAAAIRASVSDPERFGILVRRHAPAIQRYVTRRIGREPAEDVVAETFLTAFRQRAGYRDDGRACPGCTGSRRASCTATGEPFTDRVDAAVTADAAKMRLAAALAKLPAGQRDALLLLVWADLRYEQIAEATGVPLGTVQSRISRARRHLREQLADLNPANSIGDLR